jgi:hypothetical protein
MSIYLREDFKMSEKAPRNFSEKIEASGEQDLSAGKEHEKNYHEALKEHAEKNSEEIGIIAEKAQESAKSTEQVLSDMHKEHEQPENEPAIINHELKEIAYQRVLKRARRHLSPYSRTVSKIIHQPIVDSVSEVASKTIGRPSGLIGGGLLALLGTSIYYYISRHYGYNYNSFVFLALMTTGFIAGWTTEVIYKLVKRRSR